MPTLALQDPRPSSTALFSPPSSSSSTTTSAATSSLMSSIPPTTTPCPIPSCAPSTRSCPPCESSYECRLSVIQSSCQCPVASCVKKVDFDTGNSDGSIGPGTGVSNGSSGGRSILGPVLGSLTGLIIILVIVFFIARRKRQQRRDVDGNRLIDQEGQFYKFDGSVDAFDDTNKKIHESNQVWRGLPSEMEGKKDVIRIAYIPNVPEMAHLGGVPQVSFADENYDKHISIASSISTGVLDEAVLMAINKKATPKIMRLNNIKAKNSEMIQKSNNLYSSNSLKRTQSQRRTAEARRLETGAQAEAGRKEEVPETFFTEGQACEGYDAKNRQKEQQQYTPTVMVTAPSTRSSAQSMASGKRKPRPPNMVLEPRPLHPSYHVSPTSSSPAPKSESGHAMPTMMSEPILARGSSTPSTPAPTALVSLLASSPSTSYVASPSSPPPPPASAPASAPVSAPARLVPPPKSYTLDRSDHQAETLEGNGQLDPWIASIMARHFDYMDSEFSGDYGNGGRYATGGRPLAAVRNSTFSTYSDARSTMTRGDGEEIMIFWDGHRGSRASTMYGN